MARSMIPLLIYASFIAFSFFFFGGAVKARSFLMIIYLGFVCGAFIFFLPDSNKPQEFFWGDSFPYTPMELKAATYIYNALAILFFQIGLRTDIKSHPEIDFKFDGLKRGFVADFWAGFGGGLVGRLLSGFLSIWIAPWGCALLAFFIGLAISRYLEPLISISKTVSGFQGGLIGAVLSGSMGVFLGAFFGILWCWVMPLMIPIGALAGLIWGAWVGFTKGRRIGKGGYGKGGGEGFGGAALSVGSFAKSFRWSGGFSGGAGAAGSW